jgi:zinc resistance-associated protein
MMKEAKGMKKLVVVVAVIVAVGLLGTVGYAAWQGKGPCGQVDVNAFRQFQKETLSLRDEMMAKRLELRNEYAKENPDENQIARLKTEMGDLRTKIQAAAEKNGLPPWGGGPGAGRGFGGRMMGGPGCGNGGGPGAGGGPGCGRGDCLTQ